jgi:hypothetical protein
MHMFGIFSRPWLSLTLSYMKQLHWKKKVTDFPIFGRTVTYQTLPGRE